MAQLFLRVAVANRCHPGRSAPVSVKAYLCWVEYDSSQANPAVQTVHIGNVLCIVEIKHSHHRNDSQDEGENIQPCVDKLHHLLAAPPGPWQPVHYNC